MKLCIGLIIGIIFYSSAGYIIRFTELKELLTLIEQK